MEVCLWDMIIGHLKKDYFMRKYIHIIFTSLLVVFFSGCDNNPVTATLEKQGIIIRNAINANDLALLADSITLPLVFTEQEWETAGDGHGHVLGAKDTHLANNSKDLDDVLRILEHVEIEGEEPINQEFTITDFSDEFTGISQHWKSLNLTVFLRGQGDVEHILVLGFDKKSTKLRAIYIN